MKPRILGIFTALLIAGCHSIHGVESRAALPGPVAVDCVHAALTSVAEAGPVAYRRNESRATEILPRQRKVLTISHVWIYGQDGRYILQITETPDARYYRNGRTQMGRAVPEDEIVRFVPVMTAVNRTVQARCGLAVAELEPERRGSARTP